jgi:hypothetical protein
MPTASSRLPPIVVTTARRSDVTTTPARGSTRRGFAAGPANAVAMTFVSAGRPSMPTVSVVPPRSEVATIYASARLATPARVTRIRAAATQMIPAAGLNAATDCASAKPARPAPATAGSAAYPGPAPLRARMIVVSTIRAAAGVGLSTASTSASIIAATSTAIAATTPRPREGTAPQYYALGRPCAAISAGSE